MNSETIRILAVEDNPVDLMRLKDELPHQGAMRFEISSAESLLEAKQILGREEFQIILLDLGLPDSQGLETFLEARNLAPDIPIAVMSGLDDESLAIEAVRGGAQDYLVKDNWNSELLRRSICYAVERHRLMSECRRGEESLRQSEERFRAIFEGASDPIWMKDKDLRVTHMNPAMANLLKQWPETMSGLQVGDLVGEELVHSRAIDLRVLGGESVEEERSFVIGGVKSTWNIVRSPLRNGFGDIDGLCAIAREITDRRRTEPQPLPPPDGYPSKAMHSVLGQARVVARGRSSLLLLGESGSGKDYLARYIHDHSNRAAGPYFPINCAAIAPTLAESELFGHEKGAFTGAATRKRGLLELAEGGTLLLNEIGELALPLQAKLLAFLDTRRFTRVGGEKQISVDARLIAATNRNLEKEVEAGRFRKDLFYRLHVVALSLPPLRERLEDIPILVQDILAELCKQLQVHEMPVVDAATIRALKNYHWPGNVRELRNVLERALIVSGDGSLDMSSLELKKRDQPPPTDSVLSASLSSGPTLQEATDQLARAFCIDALKRSGGNKKAAARVLGISRDTLYRYLQKFGMENADYGADQE